MKSYINSIKSKIQIYSKNKSINILDGNYKSIFQGRSMDFDDLRDYIPGDDVKDIDWKSSIRNGSILVKRYVALKKHNILIIMDTNKTMQAHSKSLKLKKDIALTTAGTIAYLAQTNGDYISFIYNNKDKINYNNFTTRLYELERLLYDCDKTMQQENNLNINDTLNWVMKFIKKRMIIFIITDINGALTIKDEYYKKLTISNNIFLINIDDASIRTDNSFDINQNKNIPRYFKNQKKIEDLELNIKNKLINDVKQKNKKYNISMETISSENEIVAKIITLLERNKNGNIS